MSAASRGRDLEVRLRDEAVKQGFLADIARSVRTRLPGGGWASSAFDFFSLFDLAFLKTGLKPIYLQVTSDDGDASRHRAEIGKAFGGGNPFGIVVAVIMWSRDERAWRLWMRSSAAWVLIGPWLSTEGAIGFLADQATPRAMASEPLPEPKKIRVGPPPPTSAFKALARKKGRVQAKVASETTLLDVMGGKVKGLKPPRSTVNWDYLKNPLKYGDR